VALRKLVAQTIFKGALGTRGNSGLEPDNLIGLA
jgi:hypothetical protein